jgi:hypothetical protein
MQEITVSESTALQFDTRHNATIIGAGRSSDAARDVIDCCGRQA